MISNSDYKFISDRIGLSQFYTSDAASSLRSMVTNFINNDVKYNDNLKLWIINIIIRTYDTLVDSHVVLNPVIVSFVKALQEHVVKRFGSVDNYLSTNNLLVSPEFAAISSSAGYDIYFINIE